MKNITIFGNVTRDAVSRTTQSGQSVAGFSVAVNGFESGEKKAYFFDVSVWGSRGEAALQFATKGAKIAVTGDFGTREHNGKTYCTINASDFTPGGGATRDDSAGQRDDGPGLDDEVPF